MNIIEKIKNRLFNFSYYEKNEEEKEFLEAIKNHKVGDVIWAKRYDFDFQKERISEGHDTGPYVIVGKTQDKLICLYCTGSKKKNEIELEDYPFFHKKTYVQKYNLKAIDYESYSKNNYLYSNSLSDRDIKKILKTIEYSDYDYKYNYYGITSNFEINSNILLDVGDVILHNNHYSLIIDNKSGIIAISFDSYNPIESDINFENVSFNFRNRYLINSNRCDYINTLSVKQLDVVKKRYENYLKYKYKVDNNIIERGAIIKINDLLYYVYHSDNYISKLYLLNKVQYKNEETINGNNNYIIDFENEKSIDNKKEKYKVIEYLDDKNIDLIKDKKKSYLKNKNNNKKDEVKTIKFEFGTIIQSKKLYSLRYIVLGIINNKIITISFDSFISGNIIYKDFDLFDNSIYISNDYNLKEIKKVKENMLYLKELFNKKYEEDYKLIK